LPQSVEQGALPQLDDQIKVIPFLVVFVELKAMFVFDERLDFDLVDQPLYKFGIYFSQRNLFYCNYEFRKVVLSSIDISKTALSQNFSQPKLLEEGELLLLVEYLGPFWFLNAKVSICRSKYLQSDIWVPMSSSKVERTDINIFLSLFVVFFHQPLSFDLSIGAFGTG
jgi:hypothetical protein